MPAAWKPTWADAALSRFHFIDLRLRNGRPFTLDEEWMVAMIRAFFQASFKHKSKCHYVSVELKSELSAICSDQSLKKVEDQRARIWMTNFRFHIAPHYPSLAHYVASRKPKDANVYIRSSEV